MEVKIVGISFAVNDTPSLAMARPEGPVTFALEPENKFDKGAIRAEWEGTKIGYIAQWETDEKNKPLKDGDGNKIKNAQREAIRAYNEKHGEFPAACIDDYSYKPAGTNDFNREHIGILASIRIAVKAEAGEVTDNGNFSHYHKDGEQFERASTILEAFDAEGSRGVDGGMTRWMINEFASFDEYSAWMTDAAENGTALHLATENVCRSGVLDAEGRGEIESAIKALSDDEFNSVPKGFWNFIVKDCANLKVHSLEETVFDEDIFVAGTYDIMLEGGGKKIVVDWKSAKQVYLEHIIKTCFYAKLKDADEAWVVAFGSKNKCGYQLKKVGRTSIENGYQIMKQVAKAFYFTKDLKASMKAGA